MSENNLTNKNKKDYVTSAIVLFVVLLFIFGISAYHSVYTYKTERIEQQQTLTEKGYQLKDVQMKLVDRLTHGAYTFLVYETPDGYADTVVSAVVSKNLQYDYIIGQTYTVSVYVDDVGHCEMPY